MNWWVESTKGLTQLLTVLNTLLLVSVITGSIPISALAFLFGVPVAIASVAIGLEIFAIAAGFKKYISQ